MAVIQYVSNSIFDRHENQFSTFKWKARLGNKASDLVLRKGGRFGRFDDQVETISAKYKDISAKPCLDFESIAFFR